VLRRVAETEEYKNLLAAIRRGAPVVSLSGLIGGPARALILTLLQRDARRSFAIVAEANQDLEAWERDIRFWYCAVHGVSDCAETVLTFPASESDPYAGSSPHAETLEQRALTMWRLANGFHDFALLTARSLARRTTSPDGLKRMGAYLRRDEEFSPEELVERLVASGYVREDPVAAVGEFSIRGGILDVWGPGRPSPLRVEFFGDTVDSIREFDPETQLSTAQLKEVEIAPMREFAVTGDDLRLWAEFARDRWRDERYDRALRDRTVFADDGETFPGWEWLVSLVAPADSSVFDYLRNSVLVVGAARRPQ